MAYIINSNAKRIISEIPVVEKKRIAKTESEPVYKKQQIFFLSDLELGELLVYKKLCKDPERFTKWYQKIEVVDNYQYVFEGKTPSYHHFIDCTGLTSTFKNYKLPKKIKEQSKNKIKEFRDFVIKNQSLLEDPSNQAGREKFGLRLKMYRLNNFSNLLFIK